jgi:hypothetical protein
MSVLAIGQAAQNILAAAIQNVAPGVSVLLGHPDHFNDDIILYLYHLTYQPDVDKGSGNIRRPHEFAIHLMVRLSPDRVTTETTYLALHDAISDAFYSSRAVRELNGAAATSQLEPMTSGPNSQPYAATTEAGEFRQQWWKLTAVDNLSFNWRD